MKHTIIKYDFSILFILMRFQLPSLMVIPIDLHHYYFYGNS